MSEENKTAEEILFDFLEPAGCLEREELEDKKDEPWFEATIQAMEAYKDQHITQQQEINAELIKEINILKRQIGAYKRIKDSQEKTIAYYSEKAKDITGAIATLDSEREMNAVLTNEVEELKNQNAELVEVLTTLTDSNLFSNIVHINARAGGKKKLAEAWEKALKLLSKHTT